MRRSQLQTVARVVRGGDVLLPFRLAARAALVRAGTALGRPLTGPVQCIFAVTHRCPRRCAFCDVPWRVGGGHPEPLSHEEKLRVLDELSALGCLAVGFTGGEPTLDPGLAELVARAAALGMKPHVSSAGHRLDDPRFVEALVRSGLAGVTVSVNSTDPADPGPAGEPWRALRTVREVSGRLGSELSLTTTTVIGPASAGDVPVIVERLLEEGLEQIGVMPELDHLGRGGAAEPGYVERLGQLSRGLRRLKAETGRVENSRAYLAALAGASTAEPLPVPCFAPYSSVVVDASGGVYSCVPEWMRRRPVASVREGGLQEVWRSEAMQRRRGELAGCRSCLWNCHAELSFSLASPLRSLLGG